MTDQDKELKESPTYQYDKESNVWIAFYEKDDLGVVGQGATKEEALVELERDLKIAAKKIMPKKK